jgi:hypothetical protein
MQRPVLLDGVTTSLLENPNACEDHDRHCRDDLAGG